MATEPEVSGPVAGPVQPLEKQIEHELELGLVVAPAQGGLRVVVADVTRNGRRYDRILDIAACRSILDYRRSLAPGGRYVTIGASMLRLAQLLVVGPLISTDTRGRFGIFAWKPNDREDLAFLEGMQEAGTVRPVIDRRFHLSEVPEAIRYLETGRHLGKIVISIQ